MSSGDLKGRIAFDVTVHPGKASRERLGAAVLDDLLVVTDRFRIHKSEGDWHLRAFVKFEDIDRLREVLKPISLRYWGKRYFDRGGICRIYETPENEDAGRVCEAYRQFKERNKEDGKR